MKAWMIALIVSGGAVGLALMSRLLAAAGLSCGCR
jgi:hypothetical protein